MVSLADRPENWKHQPMPIAGKRILVTGGTTGIGRTTALLLAHQGARVMIFGRDPQHLQDAVADIQGADREVRGLAADVSELSEIQRVFR